MKSFQIINLTKNYLRNVRNAGAAQTGSEENNKSKRVCVKFSLQSESDEVVSDLSGYGAYVVDNLKSIGMDACLEEDAHRDFLASRPDVLYFRHVDSPAYRTYLQKSFDCMLVIMVRGTSLEMSETRLVYYRMQNTDRPFADQHVRNIGLNIRPVINIVQRERMSPEIA